MSSTLYLIPAPLGENPHGAFLNSHYIEIIAGIQYFITENVRTARRYLKKTVPGIIIDDLEFSILDKKTPPEDIPVLLYPLLEGRDAGLISEAGLPCIADPGNLLVAAAHKNRIRVHPIPGPSSIFLALEASGFNGQQFSFHGYLPIDKKELRSKIRELESAARSTGYTQIFMETPYRNNKLVEEVLSTCQNKTLLSIAAELTLSGEFVKTLSIDEWKKEKPDLHKRPAVFLLSV